VTRDHTLRTAGGCYCLKGGEGGGEGEGDITKEAKESFGWEPYVDGGDVS
jgi:hypothetical protein